jgi:hypothetical protein
MGNVSKIPLCLTRVQVSNLAQVDTVGTVGLAISHYQDPPTDLHSVQC